MKEILTLEGEQEIKDTFFEDNSLSPREWVARYGHTIWCGDFREYIYIDKKFEKWVYEVYEILYKEDLKDVRKEMLTQKEIKIVEEEEREM
jgi:hypothetical protein